jgi:hypothetical protein
MKRSLSTRNPREIRVSGYKSSSSANPDRANLLALVIFTIREALAGGALQRGCEAADRG